MPEKCFKISWTDLPFDPYKRFAYHGYEFYEATGLNDDEMISGLENLYETTKQISMCDLEENLKAPGVDSIGVYRLYRDDKPTPADEIIEMMKSTQFLRVLYDFNSEVQ